MAKEWTLEESIELYRLVQNEGANWIEYADIFGVTPNAVRQKFRYTDWENLFKEIGIDEDVVLDDSIDIEDLLTLEEEFDKDENIAEDEDDEDEDTDEDHTKIANKMVKEAKETIIERSNQRVVKELVKKAAETDLIYDKILSAIVKIPPTDSKNVRYPANFTAMTSPQEAALCLSDLHCGLAVLEEEVGGVCGDYNTEVFKKRLWGLVEKVIRITGHHRKSSKIDKLHIFALGDFVHGMNDVGRWGFLNTEQNIVDQVFLLMDEVQKAIIELHHAFPKIVFWGVYGNHGRMSKRGFEKPFVNWDYFIYKYLESSLSKVPGIEFKIPRAPFQVAEIMDQKFLLTHGDGIKSWAGIPFYGLMRVESNFRSMLDGKRNFDKMWAQAKEAGVNISDGKAMAKFAYNYCNSFNYMVIGHFHTLADVETNAGGRIIMNSSFFGGDNYSVNDLKKCGFPAQKFFGIHKEGRSWSYDIELDRH